jgi:excinuclease ABC subunit A
VIAEGTPEDVADSPDSYTGAYLKPILAGRRVPVAEEPDLLVS